MAVATASADPGPVPASDEPPMAAPAAAAEPTPATTEPGATPHSPRVAGRARETTAPSSVPPSSVDPNAAVSSPVLPFEPGYWTPERMADAKPMPMPTPSR